MNSTNVRIIPRLDIKGPNLVKGIRMEGLRVLGHPEDFAKKYCEDGADELIYIDVVASLYGRNSLEKIVTRTAKDMFIPLTVGGGIRSLNDIYKMLRAGADKIAINTAAIQNPGLIEEAAINFGSQCIVVSIEAKEFGNGGFEAYTDNGREKTGMDVFEWAAKACDLGAGEILITSVDRDGTGIGYDLNLIRTLAKALPVPVIASGGGGNPESVLDVFQNGGADAVVIGSMFIIIIFYPSCKIKARKNLKKEILSF